MAIGKLTLVIGLPGSGKTTLSRELATPAMPVDDDFLRELKPPFGYDGIVERLKAGGDCVANDIGLCRVDTRDRIVAKFLGDVPGLMIDFVYFANDPDQCLINVVRDRWFNRRGDAAARIDAIRRFSPLYDPPPDARPVEKFDLPGRAYLAPFRRDASSTP